MADQIPPSPDDPAAVDAVTNVRHRVLGTVMPVLQIDLDPGQRVVSPGGELSWMTSSIGLSTSTSGAGSKGVLGALKRTVAGGGLFLTQYEAQGSPGTISFAAKLPGEIRPVAIAPDREYLVHRHGFLAGTDGVNLSIGFQQKLGAGIFGGSGFILQKVTGQGTSWIALSGELVEYHLAPGENLRVIPGHVGLFDAGMSFEIQMVKGIKNMLFGADSIFFASLTGPGMVWLQTMPISL
ncbi:MAG TPA: AIM24 family protein, partial [Acidimicrobiales bacterium]